MADYRVIASSLMQLDAVERPPEIGNVRFRLITAFYIPVFFTKSYFQPSHRSHRIDPLVYSCNIPPSSRDPSLPTYLYDRNIGCVMTTSSRPREVSGSISRLWGCLPNPTLSRNYRHRPSRVSLPSPRGIPHELSTEWRRRPPTGSAWELSIRDRRKLVWDNVPSSRSSDCDAYGHWYRILQR